MPFAKANEFKNLCNELSVLIEQEGWVVRPYSHPQMNFFKLLTHAEQSAAVQRLSDFLKICRHCHELGNPIKDARVLVREGLKHFGYTCDVELDAFIQAQYMVEFYGLDHRQIFRTFNFFEMTSYTVEDIYCRHWFDLYKRDEPVTQYLLESVQPILKGESKNTIYYNNPEHIIEERSSLEKLRCWAKEKCASPLYRNGELIGYLTILDVRPVDF